MLPAVYLVCIYVIIYALLVLQFFPEGGITAYASVLHTHTVGKCVCCIISMAVGLHKVK